MKKLILLLILAFLLFGCVFIASPYYFAYQLKQAYDQKDGETIANAMDYPTLTNNMKNQLNNRFSQTLEQYPMIANLGGSSLTNTAQQFISQSVDGAIQANNIETAIRTQGQVNTETKQLAAAWAISSNKINLTDLIQDLITEKGNTEIVIKKQINKVMKQQNQELAQQVNSGKDTDKPQLNYCGGIQTANLSCFEISGNIKGYPLTIEMKRKGLLSWKIVNIKLP